MNLKHSLSLLLLIPILLASCVTLELGIETSPTPNPITEATALPIVVTQEVTRVVRETQIVVVTQEVTRIIRETVVVTPVLPQGPGVYITQGVLLGGQPRTWHTATRLYDGRILLAGGSNGINEMYTRADIFDSRTGLLTQVASLYTPRHEHTATLLPDNRVLVVGGYNTKQGWLADAEVYDPSADTWTVVPPLYSHGVQHTATLLLDGRVLVVGGCIGSGMCTNRVEIFDPPTNSWSEATSLSSVRASHTAVLLDNGKVLIAGGTLEDDDALLYDPQANSWQATGPMQSQRAQATMVKLLDGRALVVGGLSISDTPIPLGSAEFYDPVSNGWAGAASLSQPRYAHNMELAPDGQVVVVGGARDYENSWGKYSFVLDIETYDPYHDRWSIVGSMPGPVTHAAAVFLLDGRLWITGGGIGESATSGYSSYGITWLSTPLPTLPYP